MMMYSNGAALERTAAGECEVCSQPASSTVRPCHHRLCSTCTEYLLPRKTHCSSLPRPHRCPRCAAPNASFARDSGEVWKWDSRLNHYSTHGDGGSDNNNNQFDDDLLQLQSLLLAPSPCRQDAAPEPRAGDAPPTYAPVMPPVRAPAPPQPPLLVDVGSPPQGRRAASDAGEGEAGAGERGGEDQGGWSTVVRSAARASPASAHHVRSSSLSTGSASSNRSNSASSLEAAEHGQPQRPWIAANYKTDMCRNWLGGWCHWGSACMYAHGEDELRPRQHGVRGSRLDPNVGSQAPHKNKGTLCLYHLQGYCSDGQTCTYSHSEAERQRCVEDLRVHQAAAVPGRRCLADFFS